MKRGLLLRSPSDPSWAIRAFESLFPGAHAAVFGPPQLAAQAEDVGFVIRDCILVLGPVCHHIWLLRRPISEQSVAHQVLKTSTGGLWIDGCRVASDVSEFYSGTGKPRAGMGHAKGYGMGEGYGGDRANPPHPGGRWPADLVLMHTPECKPAGTKQVKGSHDTTGVWRGPSRDKHVFSGGWPGGPSVGYTSQDGTETVVAWDCSPSCFVPVLDAQGEAYGVHGAGHARMGSEAKVGETYEASCYKLGPKRLMGRFGDSGGASRFFSQFSSEDELDTWLLHLLMGPPHE